MFLRFSASILTTVLGEVLLLSHWKRRWLRLWGFRSHAQGLTTWSGGGQATAATAQKETLMSIMSIHKKGAAKSLGITIAREQRKVAKTVTKVSVTSITWPLATSPQSFEPFCFPPLYVSPYVFLPIVCFSHPLLLVLHLPCFLFTHLVPCCYLASLTFQLFIIDMQIYIYFFPILRLLVMEQLNNYFLLR